MKKVKYAKYVKTKLLLNSWYYELQTLFLINTHICMRKGHELYL